MWRFSDEARALLTQSHTAASRVDVLHSGTPVFTLNVVSGDVTAEADRPVRRNLSCRLVDATGTLTRGDVDDLLNPYDCEIAPWRGVRIYGPGASGARTVTDELAPHGVFGLTSRQVSDSVQGLEISLSGQDRAMAYQGPMSSALAISGGTPVEEAVLRLLSSRNPGLSLLTLRTGFTCGPLLYAPDIDVWREAQDLATSVGARLSHDRTGQAVLALTGPASPGAVTSYGEGDGRLLSVDRAEDSDTIRNVVVAESTDGSIRVVVEDTDPASPTYARGRYGRRVAQLKSQHFGSIDQAQQAAAARLAYELGRSETVSYTAVPDPAADVEEVHTVHRPRIGLEHRGLVVSSLSMPLDPKQAMKVECRKSVLAQDGLVLPFEELKA